MPAPRDLCRRVRELDRRRRNRVRVLTASLPAVLLAAGLATWAWRGPRENGDLRVAGDRGAGVAQLAVGGGGDTVSLEEIERLAAEADFHLLVARRMIAAFEHERAMEQVRRELALGDGLDEVRRELDVVAYRMICRADRMREAMQPSEEAVALYRQVIELFPTTHSAELARERLAQAMN